MPQGEFTYSLAEHAEMTADFTKAAFRLRPGLKFHDGHPLTTADVKWTYENYKGLNFKIFRDKLDHIEMVDDRTIIFHFKEPFVDFLDLVNGASNGIECPQALLRASGKGRIQNPPYWCRAVQVCQPGGGRTDGV
jgi:ABC-type transport system substrate-binding protein